jgi:hypothetical protein
MHFVTFARTLIAVVSSCPGQMYISGATFCWSTEPGMLYWRSNSQYPDVISNSLGTRSSSAGFTRLILNSLLEKVITQAQIQSFQQATIATDNHLRIYECLEQPSLTTWQISEEVNVQNLQSVPSPSLVSHSQTVALTTPTQTNATLDATSVSLVSQALQQGLQQSPQNRAGMGNREADGGWCVSWCKDKYWGEIIAVGCGISGTIKVYLSQSPIYFTKSPVRFETIDHTTLSSQKFHHASHP